MNKKLKPIKAWAVVSKKSGNLVRYDEISTNYLLFADKTIADLFLEGKVRKFRPSIKKLSWCTIYRIWNGARNKDVFEIKQVLITPYER